MALFFSASESLQRAMGWPVLELEELELLELEELELDELELVLPELDELELVLPELELELELLEAFPPVPLQASNKQETPIIKSERTI